MNTNALRKKILDLAIHGKLVKQDPNDESAAIVLEKIRAEKAAKIKNGELKAHKNDSYIFKYTGESDDCKADDYPADLKHNRHYEKFADGRVKDIEDEIPFALPEGWAWEKLGRICDKLVDGDHNPPKGITEKTEYIMVSSRNINHNTVVDLENVRYLTKEMFEVENLRTNATAGDILFTSVGSLGRSCIYDGRQNICFQRSVSILKTKIYNKYLKFFFDSTFYQNYVIEHATGTAQMGFYLKEMAESYIAVPPLAEQQRIVDIIEVLFAQIDTLEKNKADLQTAVKQAKAKILDLAVRGKLVPQDPADEPASAMLEKFRAEKEAKIAAGEMKRGKNDSYIYKNPTDSCYYEKFFGKNDICINEEIPFELPVNWQWCRLPHLCKIPITDGTHQTPTYSDKENGIPFLSSKDITSQQIDWSKVKYVTKELHAELQKRIQPCRNDILLAKNGTTGVAALVDTDEIFDIYVTLAVLRPVKIVYPKYLFYIINSSFCKEQFNSRLTGIGVPNLHLNDICKTIIPLPPISEQKRIVAKIEEIFSVLDNIQSNLV